MTFVEEQKEPNKLSLWRNSDNKLFIEIEPDGNDDGYQYQSITLDLEDAKELLQELSMIIRDMGGMEKEQVRSVSSPQLPIFNVKNA